MNPTRGEIWLVDLNPTRGHEQSGVRPAVIISVDEFNSCPADLVVVVPITSKNKNIPMHVEIQPEHSGLAKTSFAKPEDIRSISKERLVKKIGQLPKEKLKEMEEKIRILLGL
ncbi:type II toxin-antitoxin system PemK/MazF family toxin [Caldicellulosiruptor acetigenus]|uniref:mRNA interferase n=1 Tax=Caldicellulosiruptor acetigenus 6A TaxID=632516 RepID=G2PWA4_9FIRM|nr:type II toxin-antitoxin system PemK/MazF family toxin [Caldicellulosiruptor acetigenus]AEM74705.1 transcriptional modulator of MazE/toxin, MazF [Caldicellulosiruptor acetigenus 6A]WAM36073.1 type II toxin-antitoxin system PemK/MazF family toxin [Caldicellulosiruptor acetigenus]